MLCLGRGPWRQGALGTSCLCCAWLERREKSGRSISEVLRNEEFDRCNQAYCINSLKEIFLMNFGFHSLSYLLGRFHMLTGKE